MVPERRREMLTLIELIEAGLILAARVHIVVGG